MQHPHHNGADKIMVRWKKARSGIKNLHAGLLRKGWILMQEEKGNGEVL